MSSLKLFEIAGSIAALTGVSLTVFYFLFKTIIYKALPNLEKISRKNIVLLMFFMVWSITIVAMTTWIYQSVNHDGGIQPTIEEVEVVVEAPSQKISKQESSVKVAMYSSITSVANATTLQLFKNENQFNYTNIDDDEACGLKVRSSLWMSFNDIQPYFITFQENKVKVILKKINTETSEATFVMHLREKDKSMKLHHFTLAKNDSYKFQYNGCEYRFYYRGKTSWTTGIQYWFKTRYSGHFSIAPLKV